MGGPVAAGLLLAVVAFGLAFVGRKIAIAGIAVCVAACIATILIERVPVPAWVFAGCWASLIVTAFQVYFSKGLQRWPWLALPLAANGGVWAALVVATQGAATDVLPILATLIVIIPAGLCVAYGWALAVRVVTSWLLAVALLVGAIPVLVVHPGYVPDHRE
jgi:hypothetical protein